MLCGCLIRYSLLTADHSLQVLCWADLVGFD